MSGSPTDRFRRVDAIFDAALDLSADDQAAYVERACGDDAELRAEVFELLRAHHRPGDVVDAVAGWVAALLRTTAESLEGPVPERIGPFRVVREIGRGGMGRVFLGERADGQFEQRVALKLLQHATPGLMHRFLEERRILALLEHPGIARLIDGGIAADGLPYIAMEFVGGEPIDEYCAARGLSLESRIAIFAAVCDAVSYAHSHLVIHRDLKPSNILVTPAGQVKLLDFGIAKLLDAGGAGADETRTELRAMTPEFAAPEQVRGGPVSTATDVYALGVLLYILLTGERPYEVRGKSPAEVERIVCDSEPPSPSTKAPAPLRRRLRGDLDLIVLTALQKEERRRYQTPAALAEDLQRFRQGHAIHARPDSAPYRLRRFVGRHRTGVAAAAVLVLALAGAASRERVLRNRAEAEARNARVEARKAREVEDFLVRVFDVADPLAPQAPDGGRVTARELLDRGARRIDSTLATQPEVQAQLRTVLGRVYASLGLYDQATPLLRRSLAQRTSLHGAVDASVAESMDLLGAALVRQDKYDEAEPLLRGALAQRRRLVGNVDPTTAQSLDHLATLLEQRNEYDAAEPLYREVVTIRQALGDSGVTLANALNNLGLVRYQKGAYDEAERLYRRALDIEVRQLGENHPLTAAQMQNLANTVQMRGNLEEAERLYRRSLAAKRKALGNAHPSVTISLNNLAFFLARDRDQLDEAEGLVREAIALDRQIFGERHSYMAEGLSNLGTILKMKGEFAGAEKALWQALGIDRELFGEQHQSVARVYGNLAQIRFQVGDVDGAVRLMRQSLAQYRHLLGDDHFSTLVTMGNLGRMLAETGNAREAEELLRLALSRLDPEKIQHRPHYIGAQRTLGDAVLAQGRPDEALPILVRALEMSREQFGPENWRTADAQLAYGTALVAKGRYAEAEPLLLAARATLERNRKAQPRLAVRAAAAVARLAALDR